MKNLILLRGCPGAGKSTLASVMQIDAIISADQYFELFGRNYHHTLVEKAHLWCQEQTEAAMKLNMDIVVTNTFVKEWEMDAYFQLATKYGYKVHTVIVENRHGNTSIHDVPPETVTKMKNRFDIKLIPDQIEVKQESSEDVYAKLVKTKTYANGLTIHKYSKKVFYDNLWNAHPDIVDARGIVFDNDGNIVQYPFTKVFNRTENGVDIPLENKVTAFEKINGFMACVSLHKGKMLVSTTGSLESDYVEMAKEKLSLKVMENLSENISYCFEIVHENDPHIIEEEPGAYLIGGRVKTKGSKQMDIYALQTLAGKMGVKFSKFKICTFGEIVEDLKTSKREGWVVYDHESDTVLKLKSPYYLTTKFLARTKKADSIFSDNYKSRFDEEFYDLCEYLRSHYTAEQFSGILEQDRLTIIRDYFNEKSTSMAI